MKLKPHPILHNTVKITGWVKIESRTKQFAFTFVTTDKMATTLRISSHAPMLRAFAATGLLNCVVNFQASTRTSRMLLKRARSGASGKEATNIVMKPNWITVKHTGNNWFNWWSTDKCSQKPSYLKIKPLLFFEAVLHKDKSLKCTYFEYIHF